MREKKGGDERRIAKNSVWKFGTGNRKCRWHARVYPERQNTEVLALLPLDIWTPCKARWVWAGVVIFYLATCSLQFTKASAATLSQQEKNNSADLQQRRVNISGFFCTVAN
jgi:hypothetical protein